MTNAGSIVERIVGKGKTSSSVLDKAYNKKHYAHEAKEGLLHEEEESLEYEKKECKKKHYKG